MTAEELQWNYIPSGEKKVKFRAEDISASNVWYYLTYTTDQNAFVVQSLGGETNIVSKEQEVRNDGLTTLQIRCQVHQSPTQQRLNIQSKQSNFNVPLPRPQVLSAATEIISGNQDPVPELLDAFSDPSAIPFYCSRFLQLSELASIVDTVSAVSNHGSGRLHSARYPIIRGLLLDRTNELVQSADELKMLIEKMDEINNIGQVKFIETLGDVMAASPLSVMEFDTLLDEFQFDINSLEQRRSGLFFLASLGYRVLDRGITAAEGIALDRRYNLNQNYKRGKREAEIADLGNRGELWRDILCLSARKSRDEFQYNLLNALYWSAVEIRTDSQLTQLLYEAAETIVEDIDIQFIASRVTPQRKMAEGHRLRSSNKYVLAEKKFSTAVEMTKGDGRLEAEARQSHAINKANRQMDENEYESAVETLDTAISEIIQLDVDAEYTTHLTRVLSAKQAEFKGIIAQSNNNIQAAIDAFEDANELLDELGFDRSYRRVTGRLNQLEKQQSRKTKKSVETATNTTQSDENTFDKSAKKPTTKSNNNQNPTTEKIDNELQTRNQPKAEPETANDDIVEAIDPTLIDPTDDQPEGMHRHGESRLIDESVGDRKQE